MKVWLVYDLCGTSYVTFHQNKFSSWIIFSCSWKQHVLFVEIAEVFVTNMFASYETMKLQSCYLGIVLLFPVSGVFVITGLLNYYNDHSTVLALYIFKLIANNRQSNQITAK